MLIVMMVIMGKVVVMLVVVKATWCWYSSDGYGDAVGVDGDDQNGSGNGVGGCDDYCSLVLILLIPVMVMEIVNDGDGVDYGYG